jgi:ADP-ribose pyrophosphatase YjhB (NUDIX family)
MYKKNFNCTNCDSTLHTYKDCPEPITSWGIILVNLSELKDIPIKHQKINIRSHIYNIAPESSDDLQLLGMITSKIKFLLIQRKHSLGYVDFIRGKYKLDNIDGINFLFQHMIKSEIEKIKLLSFDDLWTDLWNNDEQKMGFLKKEFLIAKEKFTKLTSSLDLELNLDFYVNNVEPLYKSNEWGFPKGRRNRNESVKDCAIREFCEETMISRDSIKLIDSIEPIEENLIGTNGVKYRHIYYLAETTLEKLPDNNNNNEIGCMEFFTYADGHETLREYHVEKRQIITSVFYYYLENILNMFKSKLLQINF